MISLFHLIKSDGRVFGPLSTYGEAMDIYELGDRIGYFEVNELVPTGLIRDLERKAKRNQAKKR